MKYEMSWTQNDGVRVSGQIYTAEAVSSMLKNLEEQGATNITLRSNASADVDKFDIVLTMIDSRIADARHTIERNKEELEAELKHDITNVDIECYAARIRVAQAQLKSLKDERERTLFLRDFDN